MGSNTPSKKKREPPTVEHKTQKSRSHNLRAAEFSGEGFERTRG